MIEIERKFLVDIKKWQPKDPGIKIKQGFLSVDPDRLVRIRLAGEKSFLTIKGRLSGISRTELEYGIPLNEAEVLMKMCLDFRVEKTRFTEKIGDFVWEIDVFEGLNKGLVLAEIELKDENQEFELPDWIDKEVTHDLRFYNSNLAKQPYSTW